LVENGEASLWFASNAFRSFTEFMSQFNQYFDFRERNFIGGSSLGSSTYPAITHWWSGTIIPYTDINEPNGMTYGLYQKIMELNRGSRKTQFMITPPEIGPEGRQGAYIGLAPCFVPSYDFYVINADVSDAKLAKILEMFNDLAFDPELYVRANFGYLGHDFTWSGDPFDSFINRIPGQSDFVGHFAVHVRDGRAAKDIYLFPSETILNYAHSPKAMEMVIRSTPYGKTGRQKDEWDALEMMFENQRVGFRDFFGNNVSQRASGYESLLLAAHYGGVNMGVRLALGERYHPPVHTDFDYEWNRYVRNLARNGLNEYTQFFQRQLE
jgi:hypothetical protein